MARRNSVRMAGIDNPELSSAFALHNAVYGDERTEEDWIWECKGNYPELSVLTVIKDRSRVLGTAGMLPIYLNFEGQRVLTGKGEKTAC